MVEVYGSNWKVGRDFREFGNQKGGHCGHGNGTHPLPRRSLGRRA